MSTIGPILPLVFGLAFLPSTICAHRLDEYLQATLVDIAPQEIHLRINLTSGVAVADEVIAAIDRDRDGMISATEGSVYAELLKRDLTLKLDNRTLELKLIASDFPSPAELRTGWGIIQIEFAAPTPLATHRAHTITFDNRHLPAVSVYLFNAAKPESSSIQITTQKRNENQSHGEIKFAVHSNPNTWKAVAIIGVLLSLRMAIFLCGMRRAVDS